MRKLLILVCITVLALTAVGCGSSGGSDGSGDTTTKAKSTTTTEQGSSTTKAGGTAEGTDEEYLAALTANLTSGSLEDGNLVISAEEGDCVAPKWLDAITVEGFTSVQVSPDDVSDPNFTYSKLELDSTKGKALIDAFDACGVDIYAKLAESLTVGLTEEQQACAQEKVDPAVANDLLVTAFSTDAGDGSAEFTALLDQLQKACDLPAS